MSAFEYAPQGVCSRLMKFDIEDNKIHNLKVVGGCNGNLQGISRLVAGQKIDDVIARLNGIDCGGKGTSCPDQLCRALEQLKNQ